MKIKPILFRVETEVNHNNEIQQINCHYQEFLCDDSETILLHPDGTPYQLEGYKTIVLYPENPLLEAIPSIQKQIRDAFLQELNKEVTIETK